MKSVLKQSSLNTNELKKGKLKVQVSSMKETKTVEYENLHNESAVSSTSEPPTPAQEPKKKAGPLDRFLSSKKVDSCCSSTTDVVSSVTSTSKSLSKLENVTNIIVIDDDSQPAVVEQSTVVKDTHYDSEDDKENLSGPDASLLESAGESDSSSESEAESPDESADESNDESDTEEKPDSLNTPASKTEKTSETPANTSVTKIDSITEVIDAVLKSDPPSSITSQVTSGDLKVKKKRRSMEDIKQKKLIKEMEKSQRRVEKERAHLIRRQEKEKLRKQKLEEREKLNLERKLKRDQEEKEKEEKRKQREEEKKLRDAEKEEERIKKEEEKNKKEEERLQKELEKKKEEELLTKKMEKQRSFLTNFFIKIGPVEPTEKVVVTTAAPVVDNPLFMKFELKKDMKIAPIHRLSIAARSKKCSNLDTALTSLKNNSNYLLDLKKGLVPGKSDPTWPIEQPDLTLLTCSSASTSSTTPPKPHWLRAKFFQFVENYRPAYRGTWRKTSKTVTRRRPFARDTRFLDYEVDSDDEWEEEDPGENISHSEGEDDEEETNVLTEDGDDDDDGFFVPHGYLSDDEGAVDEDDEEVAPQIRKIRQQLEERQFEASQHRKLQPLKPCFHGPRWIEDQEKDDGDVLRQYKVHMWTESYPISCEINESPNGTPVSKSPKSKYSVPKEAIPDLVRLLHNNPLGIQKLVYEFRMYWEKTTSGILPEISYLQDKLGQDWDRFQISKGQLRNTIKKLAVYEDSRWVVRPVFLDKLEADSLGQPWNYVSDILSLRNKTPRKEKDDAMDTSANTPTVAAIPILELLQQAPPPASPTVHLSKQPNAISPQPSVISSNVAPSSPTLPSQPAKKAMKRASITSFFTSTCSASKKSKADSVPPLPNGLDNVIVIDSP